MITAALIFGVWAIGAVAVYRCDRDPRATEAERLQYSAMWPLFALIIVVLGAAWGAGKVYRAICPHKVI
jgi:hypothetical protein